MSSAARFIRAIVNKRPNQGNWSLIETAQGFVFLKDEHGRLLAFPTVQFNPSDTDPISPGSVGNVGLLDSLGTRIDPKSDDPIWSGAGTDIPYSITKKAAPVYVVAYCAIQTTHTEMTFESPSGTDYQVPTGKTLFINRLLFSASIADAPQVSIGYGDTGVASGIVLPTAPVFVVGQDNASVYVATAANITYDPVINAQIPAGKFPFANMQGGLTTVLRVAIFGVEVTAV